MEWRTPAGPLIHEHRVIERLIAVLDRSVQRLDAERTVDVGSVDAVVDFIRTYADRCHHNKEEFLLFSKLAEKDMPPSLAATMKELIDEHAYARRLTARLADADRAYEAGREDALQEIASAMRGLAELYPRHIEKEERHFFRECLDYLTADEKAELLERYAEFDRTLIHEKYREVVEELERDGK